jgi:hypothetical protein
MEQPKKKSNFIIPVIIITGIIIFLYFKNKKTGIIESSEETDSSSGGGGGGGYMGGGMYSPAPVVSAPVGTSQVTPAPNTGTNPPAGTSQVTTVPEVQPVEKTPTDAELKALEEKAKADALAKEQQLALNFHNAAIAAQRIKREENEIYTLSSGLINNQEQIKIDESKAIIAEQKEYMKTLGFYLPAGSSIPKKI